jgi:hypothetical protein
LPALAIALVSLMAIVYYNAQVAGLFAALAVAGGAVTAWRRRRGSSAASHDTLLSRPGKS